MSKQENVAIYIDDLSAFGGAAVVTKTLYFKLKSACYPNIEIIDLFSKPSAEESISVISIFPDETDVHLDDLDNRLSTILTKNNIRVLIIAVTSLKTAYKVGVVAKNARCRIICVLHNSPYSYRRNFISKEEAFFYPKMLIRKVAKDTIGYKKNYSVLRWMIKNALIVTVGHECEKEFKILFPDVQNITTIYNFVNIPEACEAKEKPSKKICYVGRFSPQKNMFLLLKVWKEFVKLEPEYILMLVGDGEEKAEMKKYIMKNNISNIEFTGKISKIDNIYRNSDVCILTSFYEGLPTVFLEALRKNCLIFATKGYGGGKELILNFENGYYSDNTNPAEIAVDLQNLVNSVQYPLNISAVSGEFTDDYILNKWKKIIE